MSRALLILAATVLVGTGFSARAEATAINIDNIVTTPTTLGADIVVSDLNQVTGAFAFQVAYNTADLTGNSYVNDPTNKLGDGANPILDLSFGFGSPGPGFLDLFVISTKSDAQLAALQGPFPTSFVLAHVLFDRTSPTALTGLGLVNVSLSEGDGVTTIPLGGAAAVPEPATMLLLGTGLVAAAARRRKQNKSQL